MTWHSETLNLLSKYYFNVLNNLLYEITKSEITDRIRWLNLEFQEKKDQVLLSS